MYKDEVARMRPAAAFERNNRHGQSLFRFDGHAGEATNTVVLATHLSCNFGINIQGKKRTTRLFEVISKHTGVRLEKIEIRIFQKEELSGFADIWQRKF